MNVPIVYLVGIPLKPVSRK